MTPSQSAPIILVLKTWVGLWPCKKRKKGPKYGLQKAGCKKTGSLLFKKRRGLFLSPCFFQVHILDLIFLGSQTDPCFQNKNNGCRLTGRLWNVASVCTCFTKLILYVKEEVIFTFSPFCQLNFKTLAWKRNNFLFLLSFRLLSEFTFGWKDGGKKKKNYDLSFAHSYNYSSKS